MNQRPSGYEPDELPPAPLRDMCSVKYFVIIAPVGQIVNSKFKFFYYFIYILFVNPEYCFCDLYIICT